MSQMRNQFNLLLFKLAAFVGRPGIRKKIIPGLLILFFTFLIALLVLVKTDRILLRTPVLFQEKPLVTHVIGRAQMRPARDQPWRDLLVGTHLDEGAEIKTGKKSLVDIRLHRSTVMRVSAGTCILIDYLSIRKLLIKIEWGTIYGKFKKLFEYHNIRFITPNSTASIRGTELAINTQRRRGEDEVDTSVYGLSGIIEVYKPAFREQTVLLSNRNKLLIAGGNPPDNPEKMTDSEIEKMQAILNSLHFYEVLFISQKIYFKTASDKILKKSYGELDRIARSLLERDEKILIKGHTDNIGAAYENQALSLKRADSIKRYLEAKGVDSDMLAAAGYGESKPVASNDTERGRALNRRVEFVVLDE